MGSSPTPRKAGSDSAVLPHSPSGGLPKALFKVWRELAGLPGAGSYRLRGPLPGDAESLQRHCSLSSCSPLLDLPQVLPHLKCHVRGRGGQAPQGAMSWGKQALAAQQEGNQLLITAVVYRASAPSQGRASPLEAPPARSQGKTLHQPAGQ